MPISAICLMGIIAFHSVGTSQSSQPTIRLLTDPPLERIRPFEAEAATPQSPVKLTLQALDAGGNLLEDANIRLTLLAPPKNLWFPTDFPIVEGTKLLEIEGFAPQGELQIEQMLPIRGTYQLQVKATPKEANAFEAIEQNLTLSVREDGVKYRNFAILAIALLGIGLIGGLVIGGEQTIQPGEVAPARVRFLLSGAAIAAIFALLFINISAELADSHSSHPLTYDRSETGTSDRDGLEVQLLGDSEATVGIAASFQVRVMDNQTHQAVSGVNLAVTTMALEGNWVAFAYQGTPDATGKLTWQEQFFDGAPHRVEVTVSPQTNSGDRFSPIVVNKVVEVKGIAPPLSLRLRTLALMTAIVALGLGIGLRLRCRIFKFL